MIKTRKATSEDIPDILRIQSQSFKSDCLSSRRILYLLKKGRSFFWVIEESPEKGTVGYAILLWRKNSKKLRLYYLAIDAPFRRQGLGKLFFQLMEAEAKMRGFTEIIFEVRPDNKKAHKFYANLGYEVFGAYPAFYEDGAEAIRMGKSL